VGALAEDRAATRAAPTIGRIVGGFKSSFTVAYIQGVRGSRWPAFHRRVWQRNYYEHIIRDEPDLARIRRYIGENPLRWEFDRENPLHVETYTEERS
jgi:putative transposase